LISIITAHSASQNTIATTASEYPAIFRSQSNRIALRRSSSQMTDDS
jgi:hypothetical protein